jgi:four helix bundle protein
MPKKIQYHWEIDAYKLSVEAAMEIYELSKSFPKEERDCLTSQIRKYSRSVSTQIAKGWRRRKYLAGFVDKMNQAEAEAAKTQARLGDCATLKYLKKETSTRLHNKYQQIKGKLQKMGNNPQQWVLKSKKR